MTSPSTAPDAAEAVRNFLVLFPECEDSESIRDRCYAFSIALTSWLATTGIDSQVISGFRMEGRVILNGHYAVRVGDDVYDVTYRQFDPTAPVPLITPYADWRADWRTL